MWRDAPFWNRVVLVVLVVLAAAVVVCFVWLCPYYERHRGVDPHRRIRQLHSTIEAAGVHCEFWSERGENEGLLSPDYNVDGTCRLDDGLPLRSRPFERTAMWTNKTFLVHVSRVTRSGSTRETFTTAIWLER